MNGYLFRKFGLIFSISLYGSEPAVSIPLMSYFSGCNHHLITSGEFGLITFEDVCVSSIYLCLGVLNNSLSSNSSSGIVYFAFDCTPTNFFGWIVAPSGFLVFFTSPLIGRLVFLDFVVVSFTSLSGIPLLFLVVLGFSTSPLIGSDFFPAFFLISFRGIPFAITYHPYA